MSEQEQGGLPIEVVGPMFLERMSLSQEAEVLRTSVADEAVNWLGAPSVLYRGPEQGLTPEGFDCSGFARFVLQRAGIDIPDDIRHSNEFFDSFGVFVHWPLHRRGDLVFFSRSGESPTHMGIVLDPQHFIHAPGKDRTEVEIEGLRTNPIRDSSARAIHTTNPIGFKRIALPMSTGRWKVY